MEFCEHVKYDEDKKTYHIHTAVNVNKDEATCAECGANIDIEPLMQGGCALMLMD